MYRKFQADNAKTIHGGDTDCLKLRLNVEKSRDPHTKYKNIYT